MDYFVEEQSEKVTFYYKLKDGVSKKSYALNVARMVGID